MTAEVSILGIATLTLNRIHRGNAFNQVTTAAVEEKVVSDLLDALLLGAPGSARDFKASAARYVTPPMSDLPIAELEQEFAAKRLSLEAIEGVASPRERRKPSWYPPK